MSDNSEKLLDESVDALISIDSAVKRNNVHLEKIEKYLDTMVRLQIETVRELKQVKEDVKKIKEERSFLLAHKVGGDAPKQSHDDNQRG